VLFLRFCVLISSSKFQGEAYEAEAARETLVHALKAQDVASRELSARTFKAHAAAKAARTLT
jgi:hypothetical protein